MSYHQGVDISKHQGDVDHSLVADSGMVFCICKATEGRNYEDPKFERNIQEIRKVLATGKPYYPGAYHFARPSSDGGGAEDGRAEAEDFCDVIERVCGDILENFMPPALDFEEYSDSSVTDNTPWISAWIEVVEERLGRKPMIYTGKNVWHYEMADSSAFKDYPLWQVYYSGTASQPPKMPWDTWSLWQWSGGGDFQYFPDVPGIGVADVNRWNGSLEELKMFANASSTSTQTWPTPPPTVDLNIYRGKGYTPYVARVQGLLLAHQYGPSGLTQNGSPDGKMGDKTQTYLIDFKVKRGLPADAVMDWATWWALAYDLL